MTNPTKSDALEALRRAKRNLLESKASPLIAKSLDELTVIEATLTEAPTPHGAALEAIAERFGNEATRIRTNIPEVSEATTFNNGHAYAMHEAAEYVRGVIAEATLASPEPAGRFYTDTEALRAAFTEIRDDVLKTHRLFQLPAFITIAEQLTKVLDKHAALRNAAPPTASMEPHVHEDGCIHDPNWHENPVMPEASTEALEALINDWCARHDYLLEPLTIDNPALDEAFGDLFKNLKALAQPDHVDGEHASGFRVMIKGVRSKAHEEFLNNVHRQQEESLSGRTITLDELKAEMFDQSPASAQAAVLGNCNEGHSYHRWTHRETGACEKFQPATESETAE